MSSCQQTVVPECIFEEAGGKEEEGAEEAKKSVLEQ